MKPVYQEVNSCNHLRAGLQVCINHTFNGPYSFAEIGDNDLFSAVPTNITCKLGNHIWKYVL